MTPKSLLFSFLATLAFAVPAMAQKGGVAVIDIDEVARQLGVEEKVRVDLQTMQDNLNAELKRSQETMQKQMEGVEKKAGENPTDDQKRQIIATNQQLNDEFNRLKAQAQNTLGQERVRLINEFRNRLQPIALKAAQEQGFEVVLMKVTPPVFTYAQSVDITQATTKLALEAGLQVQVAPVTNAPAPAATPVAVPAEAPKAGAKGESKEKGKGKGE